MLNKHRGILKYHLLNNYLCKLNRGLVPIDPKRYISRICCLFYGGRSCTQIHMFVRNMPHSPVTVNLSGMLDRRKLRIKYLYYLYDASVCIYNQKYKLAFLLLIKNICLPPSQVFWSERSSVLSWQPHVLPVGVGKQNVLQSPLFLEHRGFTTKS